MRKTYRGFPDFDTGTSSLKSAQVHYNVGSITVDNLVFAGPGDANKDGKVDDNDLSILLTNWNTGTVWTQGNFKGSTTVDDNDLSILLSNWTGSGAGVPEPGVLVLLALGGLGSLWRRR